VSYPAIGELLPHQPPMLWLDEVLHRDDSQVRCALQITEGHVFVQDGSVEPLVSIEWMAQAVGALVGMGDRLRGETPRPGYLIAIPEASFEVDAFAVGDRLLIEAKRVWGDDDLASFECTVERAGRLAARAQIRVYRGKSPFAGKAPGPGDTA
jgi:predicted hotdog family 3-hydroxylacyl-ACP dehydratase